MKGVYNDDLVANSNPNRTSNRLRHSANTGMEKETMTEAQYNIVKIFTDMKIPKQLEKISKVFKIPLAEVHKVAGSYNFQQYQIPDKDRGYDFGSMFGGDNPFAGMGL